MSWDYAELSKRAKLNGGPEAFADKLVQYGFSKGKKSMYPFVGGAIVVAPIVWEGGKSLWKKITSSRKVSITEEEYEAARKELIQVIKEYDAKHSDETSDDNNITE